MAFPRLLKDLAWLLKWLSVALNGSKSGSFLLKSHILLLKFCRSFPDKIAAKDQVAYIAFKVLLTKY